MRLLLLTLTLFSIGSFVAAAYSARSVGNYMAYANVTSRQYAEGEANDSSGWRDCSEAVNAAAEVGVICEGLRTIHVHGKDMNVNYYCEFHFKRIDSAHYRVEMEVCQ